MSFRGALVAIGAAWALSGPALAADVAVDVALVFAVDVSLSIDEGEAAIQRRGYLHALRDKRFAYAAGAGPTGRIAVTYVEWSGAFEQMQMVPWRIISDAASANAFADELEKTPIKSGGTTSISGGIDFAVKLIKTSGFRAGRKVIDVSSDGYSDYGRPIKDARKDAVDAGITINGLAMVFDVPKWRQDAPADLERYFHEEVIGGRGAFYLSVKTPDDFSQALLSKLIREVASRDVTPASGG